MNLSYLHDAWFSLESASGSISVPTNHPLLRRHLLPHLVHDQVDQHLRGDAGAALENCLA